MLKRFLKKFYAESFSVFLAALLLGGCAATAQKAADLPEGPWPTYQHDYARTNASEAALDMPLRLRWASNISKFRIYNSYPKSQLSSPVLHGGALYVGSTNGKFYSFDLETGALYWKRDLGHPVESSATAEGDTVCFGTSAGAVNCLERSTGEVKWSFQSRSEVLSSPVIISGKLIFSSSDDRVYALDADTGEKIWSYTRGTFQTVAPRLYASPAAASVSLDGSTIYQFFSDGFLVCLSVETGKELWSRKVVDDFDSSASVRRTPMVAGSEVYIIDGKNSVQALSAETGEVTGIFNIIDAVDFVIAGEKTLVIAGLDTVVAIDRVKGSILWKTELEINPINTVFASRDHLLVVSNFEKRTFGLKFFSRMKGRLDVLSLETGSKVWSRNYSASISAGGSIAENTVALFTDKGSLEVYMPR